MEKGQSGSGEFYFIVFFVIFFFIYPIAVYSLTSLPTYNTNTQLNYTPSNIQFNQTINNTQTFNPNTPLTRPCGTSVDAGQIICYIGFLFSVGQVDSGIAIFNFIFIVMFIIFMYIMIKDVILPIVAIIIPDWL